MRISPHRGKRWRFESLTEVHFPGETRNRPLLRAVLETTMVAFEDAFFGNKTLSREMFERSWSRVNEFRLELEHQEQAAA